MCDWEWKCAKGSTTSGSVNTKTCENLFNIHGEASVCSSKAYSEMCAPMCVRDAGKVEANKMLEEEAERPQYEPSTNCTDLLLQYGYPKVCKGQLENYNTASTCASECNANPFWENPELKPKINNPYENIVLLMTIFDFESKT